jgi:aquaporin Z
VNKYITEFIGSFFLVLSIIMSTNNGNGALAPLAIGATLMVMVYAGGHISGAHYNPAVTLGLMLRGKMDRADVLPYMLAQLIGAIIAAFMAAFLLVCKGGVDIRPVQHFMFCSIFAEFLGTFAWVYVLLNVSTTQSNSGNSYHGLAIGFVAMAMTFAMSGVSVAVFNPAAAVGAAIAGMISLSDIWIYLIGSGLGGATATVVFLNLYGRGD